MHSVVLRGHSQIYKNVPPAEKGLMMHSSHQTTRLHGFDVASIPWYLNKWDFIGYDRPWMNQRVLPPTRPKGSPVNLLVPGTTGHPQRSPVDVGHLVYILLLWLTVAWMQYFISTSFEAFLRWLWKREKRGLFMNKIRFIIISHVDFLTGVGEDMNKSRNYIFYYNAAFKAGKLHNLHKILPLLVPQWGYVAATQWMKSIKNI